MSPVLRSYLVTRALMELWTGKGTYYVMSLRNSMCLLYVWAYSATGVLFAPIPTQEINISRCIPSPQRKLDSISATFVETDVPHRTHRIGTRLPTSEGGNSSLCSIYYLFFWYVEYSFDMYVPIIRKYVLNPVLHGKLIFLLCL